MGIFQGQNWINKEKVLPKHLEMLIAEVLIVDIQYSIMSVSDYAKPIS